MHHSVGNAPEAILKEYWGYPGFRSGQSEVVHALMAGRDALAVLPTGGGKSICYQVPALASGGLTLVVSPLIALMHDQVAGLRARGVSAAFITSQLSRREVEQHWTDAEHGRYRLLYVAPERLESELFVARAERLPVRLLAVDEAHCISEWGPDFRPSYRRIVEAAELLGRPTTVAVTATATPEVRRDIREQLQLRDPLEIVAGFDRPNIIPSVFASSAKLEKAVEVLNSVKGSGIVYTMSRAGAEGWAKRLSQAGISATAYHAGMTAADRHEAQSRWLSDSVRVIAATNAFGMGIDKPDVRTVIHVDLPLSLEAYYQEAGRAGRDGKRSYSVLLFAESDAADARSFIDDGHPEAASVQKVYETVLSMNRIAIGSASEIPIVVDIESVSKAIELSPMGVRAAVEVLVRAGVWQEVRSSEHRGMLRMLSPADYLLRLRDESSSTDLAKFLEGLVRGVPAAAYHDWHELDFRDLERSCGLPRTRLVKAFDFLAQRELLTYQAPGHGLRVRLLGSRSQRVAIDHEALRASRKRAERRLGDVIRYTRSIACRRRYILTYFGEGAPDHCGSCDNCLGRHTPPSPGPEDEARLRSILQAVADSLPVDGWLKSESLPAHRVLALADWLVGEGYLELADPISESFALTAKGRAALQRN